MNLAKTDVVIAAIPMISSMNHHHCIRVVVEDQDKRLRIEQIVADEFTEDLWTLFRIGQTAHQEMVAAVNKIRAAVNKIRAKSNARSLRKRA